MGVQIPQWEGAILGETGAHCKVQGLSAVSCGKTLNRSISRLGLNGPKETHVESYLPGVAKLPDSVQY